LPPRPCTDCADPRNVGIDQRFWCLAPGIPEARAIGGPELRLVGIDRLPAFRPDAHYLRSDFREARRGWVHAVAIFKPFILEPWVRIPPGCGDIPEHAVVPDQEVANPFCSSFSLFVSRALIASMGASLPRVVSTVLFLSLSITLKRPPEPRGNRSAGHSTNQSQHFQVDVPALQAGPRGPCPLGLAQGRGGLRLSSSPSAVH